MLNQQQHQEASWIELSSKSNLIITNISNRIYYGITGVFIEKNIMSFLIFFLAKIPSKNIHFMTQQWVMQGFIQIELCFECLSWSECDLFQDLEKKKKIMERVRRISFFLFFFFVSGWSPLCHTKAVSGEPKKYVYITLIRFLLRFLCNGFCTFWSRPLFIAALHGAIYDLHLHSSIFCNL
jgi:hypothetical protein